jgi:N-acetylglucosaminyldiphosphoundecaprenol N-acetyl-beta-D-mannosaminyltransferase
MSIAILGVRLDRISSRAELEARCERLLSGDRTRSIFTPNPEILVRASSDRSYSDVLNGADLLLPDGIGILFVQSLRRGARVRRWPGTDSAGIVLDVLARRGGTVLLLGGREGVAPAAAARLRTRWPGLRIETAGEGVPFGTDGVPLSSVDDSAVIRAIRELEPQVVLVGLGAPKQERWIHRHSSSFPSVRVMMGIGGAMDMWAGRLPRAPRIFTRLGMEWLWRLLQNDPVILAGTPDVAEAITNSDELLVGVNNFSRMREVPTGRYNFTFVMGLQPADMVNLPHPISIMAFNESPNAAKLFMRHLLTLEGGAPWFAEGNPSPRTDWVPPEPWIEPILEHTKWDVDYEFLLAETDEVIDFWTLHR